MKFLQKHSGERKMLWTCLLSFVLPVGLLFAAFGVVGIYPFGEKALLVADMNNEYIDYLAYLNRVLRGQGSLLRSWEMGMGLNMLGLVAFYIASPFNLLIAAAPLEWLTEAVLLVTLFKVGGCGFTFCLYLHKTLPGKLPPALLVALSVAYGMNAYNIAYSSNIMWLDGVAVLPLVIWGTEQVLEKSRYRLLVCSLVYAFLTSYYIAYMIGLFSFLYFTAMWFARGGGVKRYGHKLLGFMGGAALAAGIGAFLLLPAFLNLKIGQEAMWDPTISITWRLEDPLELSMAKLLPGAFDTLTDQGSANIYCTIAGGMGAALYFFSNRISRREKLICGALSLLLLYSLSCELLYMGWHAFEDPTWYPARFSFVICFWLLTLASRCAADWEGLGPWGGAAVVGLFLMLVSEAAANRYPFLRPAQLWLALGLITAYSLIAWGLLGKRTGRTKRLLSLMLLLLVCGECGWSAWKVVDSVDNRFRYRTRESYTAFRENRIPLLEAQAPLLGEGGPYRTELTELRNANGGLGLGYRPISHYSTTTDQSLNSFLKGLGYNTGIINELYFAPNTPLTNGMLGVRYVLSQEPLDGYDTVISGEGEAIGLFENPAVFPLAYFGDGPALQWIPQGEDPFALQNQWVGSLWSDLPNAEVQDPFQPLELLEVRFNGVKASAAEDGAYIQYTSLVRTGDPSVEWVLANPAGLPAYAYLPVYRNAFSRAVVMANDREYRELAYRNNTVLYLGSDKEITVRLELESDRARLAGAYFYSLNPETVEIAAAKARENGMEFSRFQDTRVEGTVSATQAGALLTSFPYDNGWRIQVNGRRIRPERYAGVFLAIPLEKGEHVVQMRYRPPGFYAGCCISLLTLLGFVIWRCYQCRKKE